MKTSIRVMAVGIMLVLAIGLFNKVHALNLEAHGTKAAGRSSVAPGFLGDRTLFAPASPEIGLSSLIDGVYFSPGAVGPTARNNSAVTSIGQVVVIEALSAGGAAIDRAVAAGDDQRTSGEINALFGEKERARNSRAADGSVVPTDAGAGNGNTRRGNRGSGGNGGGGDKGGDGSRGGGGDDSHSLGEKVIPEDRSAWNSLREDDRVGLYILLNNAKLNAAMRKALAGGASEKDLYRDGSPIHEIALKTLAPVKKAASRLEKEGLGWASNYNFNASGSTLLVGLVGTKRQVIQALAKADVSKAWLGSDAESLPGNHLLMRDGAAYANAVMGVSTVYLRGGIDKGYKVGPGQINLKDSDEVLPVYFEKVEELPYAKVGADILNGLAAGLTWEDMLKTMQSYYPGFTADNPVTVIRYRRR